MAVDRRQRELMRILHIAAHMGAGAGKAISGMAISDRENKHRILLLDKPEKSDHIMRCGQRGIDASSPPNPHGWQPASPHTQASHKSPPFFP